DQAAPSTAPGRRVLAAPAVRKLAFELGVDLEQVTASNANERVSLEDVKAYAEHPKSASTPPVVTAPASVGTPFMALTPTAGTQTSQSQDERQPLTGLRKRIAEHMEHSWRTIPHATAFGEVDASKLVTLRDALKPAAEKRGIRLT